MARNLEKDSIFETADWIQTKAARPTAHDQVSLSQGLPTFTEMIGIKRFSLRGKEALKEKAMHA